MSYDFRRRESVLRFKKDREGELAAVREGRWPRDIDDQMRWTPAGLDRTQHLERVARLCTLDIEYADRLLAGGDFA